MGRRHAETVEAAAQDEPSARDATRRLEEEPSARDATRRLEEPRRGAGPLSAWPAMSAKILLFHSVRACPVKCRLCPLMEICTREIS